MVRCSVGIVLLGLFGSPCLLAQSLSANIGWNSNYIFRGIEQKNSSAFAGLDAEAGNFYAGTWAADVGDGLEIDYYGGYGVDVGDFNFSLGGTWYTYSGHFDDDYLEMNASAGWKFLSFAAAFGKYDNFAGPTLHYRFYSVTASHNGFYGKLGTFEDDFAGTYYEAGYGNSLSVGRTNLLDYSFAVIHSNARLLGGSADTNLVLTLSKTFSF